MPTHEVVVPIHCQMRAGQLPHLPVCFLGKWRLQTRLPGCLFTWLSACAWCLLRRKGRGWGLMHCWAREMGQAALPHHPSSLALTTDMMAAAPVSWWPEQPHVIPQLYYTRFIYKKPQAFVGRILQLLQDKAVMLRSSLYPIMKHFHFLIR